VPPTATGRRTLALHFDGFEWNVASTPNATFTGVDLTALEGVVTFLADDAWAVGHGDDFGSFQSETVALHWDGAAWTRVVTPNPAGRSQPNKLFSVHGVAPNDLWAVGEFGFPARALTLHFDGSAWSRVPAPGRVALRSVFAVASNDVWAVGGNLVIHWDGAQWTKMRTPRPLQTGGSDQFEDVSASGPNDVWVTGATAIPSGEHVTFAPVVLHWNGTRWTRITITGSGQIYNAVHAAGPADIWVGGVTSNGAAALSHSTGGSFQGIPTPPATTGAVLADINVVPGGDLLAVGTQFERDAATARTLILEAPSSTQGQVIGDTNVSFASVAWFGTASGSAETDLFGDFFAPGLPAGDYTFVITNDGCDPAVADITVAAGESVEQAFTVVC
jgi:hypothetical protein